ncbi:MAG TPA: DUF1326 domain-containing protein [bacterium]|nr:DUF1326 domain-containing protein [bacterium]
MPKTPWKMKGHYVKNCNCLATCPCDTIGVPFPDKGCEGMAGMQIREGHFGKVKLDGLRWAAVYRWPGALHEGNGQLQPFVDERAKPEQRDAILQILSGKHGGTYFEILASIITQIYEPQFVPIRFKFDKKGRKALVEIPGFLETVTESLVVPANGKKQRVIVRMPEGFEYREMEVCSAKSLKSTGAIPFEYQNTHSSLADVVHTHKGLVA